LKLPYNKDAEIYVIGSIILENELMDKAMEKLTDEDFYEFEHRNIFKAMMHLYQKKRPIDPITIIDIVKHDGIQFEQITSFINKIASTHQVEHYINIIKDKSAKRKLIKIVDDVKTSSFKGNENISEIVSQCIKDIQILDNEETDDINYIPDIIDGVLEEIKLSNKSGVIAGLKTGFHDLDKLTGGWQKGRYYILGARPKMGKTSLFCQIAEIAANQKPTIIFSLEMSKKELMKMLIYQNSKIDSMLEQNGELTQKEFNSMRNACDTMKNKDLYIDDRCLNMQQIKTSLKNIQKDLYKRGKGKVGLIVIDYVQMIHGDNKLSRNYQLEEISRGLKEIAKQNELCVLALSQLSRAVDDRTDRKPIPSDLRDSGSFEQDCDGLMLMYRDCYYKGQTADNTHPYTLGTEKVLADIVDINMFLNRHGKADRFQLHFLTPYRKFVETKDFYGIEKLPWDE
jgi:replicative DNA helicase